MVSVLRIGKNKWYAFDAMFRHDENFWDYSLLANPFNPATPVANAPANFNPLVNATSNVLGTTIVGISPHYYNTRRNMQNYNVTFLPDSKIRLRAGYNLNTNTGPDFSTIHQGTEQFLLQKFRPPSRNIDWVLTSGSFLELTSAMTRPGATTRRIRALRMKNQQFSVGSGLPPVDLESRGIRRASPVTLLFKPAAS